MNTDITIALPTVMPTDDGIEVRSHCTACTIEKRFDAHTVGSQHFGDAVHHPDVFVDLVEHTSRTSDMLTMACRDRDSHDVTPAR
jgi:hypothetical protein